MVKELFRMNKSTIQRSQIFRTEVLFSSIMENKNFLLIVNLTCAVMVFGVEYKFTKVEVCNTTNPSFISIDSCTVTPSGDLTLTIDAKAQVDQVIVRN